MIINDVSAPVLSPVKAVSVLCGGSRAPVQDSAGFITILSRLAIRRSVAMPPKRAPGKTDGPAAKQSKGGTNWEGTEWGSKATTQAGQSWQLKVTKHALNGPTPSISTSTSCWHIVRDVPHRVQVTTWNVSGLRACVSKGGAELLARESPDILCLQETKCSQDKLPPEVRSANRSRDQCNPSS